ncbi:Uma2 family endonuclease [Synechococcales cyanobacterium C]|uniref:Uma2 family endonuclease n=1 Tax=Petrachloros mirabilis ULC683 TaxID=2781853 RepID=A0A8K2A9K3_9CYAN|nr:Uma2 family endonuclease [Petrachloros mirabilis]NCJ08290.1 Uma2 family endonuclease [Petrachloros mirabilis ULC683]
MTTTLRIQTETTPVIVSLPTNGDMTRDEFSALCLANRDLRIERTATGEVIIMPPAFSDTGNRNFNLAAHLWVWSEQDGTGLGFDSSAGFTLPNGAIRAPDAAWIRAERWHGLTEDEKASFAPICPDFVIELRSTSDTLKSVQAKMQEYLENGAQLGWLIDRKSRKVHIYRLKQAPQVLENPEQVSGDPELTGFSLPMAKIW